MDQTVTNIAIVGGGIAGLALALGLHARGVKCTVVEAVPEVKELGVGITLLPHGMAELERLGVMPEICAAGIENYESVFFNRHGQFIYKELRGKHAGYPLPEIGIHRGKLHRILYEKVRQTCGENAVLTGHRLSDFSQDDAGVTLQFENGRSLRAALVIGCDGIHSQLRRRYYPDEKLAFAGINTWRGVTRMPPIFDGRTYMRIGSIETGKMVVYPIVNYDDGTQLVNWMAEIRGDKPAMNDWNLNGDAQDFLPIYADWKFDWLDVPKMIRGAERVLEYPMVDKDPVARWTYDRITLAGDAAHPMYPRGSNGSAQALIDARTLADCLAAASHAGADLRPALIEYENARRTLTGKIVETNRTTPPDFINIKVDELTGGKPFRHIDDVISQTELRAISEHYKQVAGFALPASRG